MSRLFFINLHVLMQSSLLVDIFLSNCVKATINLIWFACKPEALEMHFFQNKIVKAFSECVGGKTENILGK